MSYASVTYTSASGTTFALTNSNGDPISYIRQSDIKVYVNTVLQAVTTDYTFNSAGTAIVLNSAVSGATVLLQRITDITDATVVYTAGSTLTAQDLNNADNQIRFGLQEFQDSVNAGGGVPDGDKGDISVAGNGTVWSIDAGAVTETKLGSGAVTSAKIADGTIVNADINASAAIAVSKLASGTARQFLQINSAGTAPEWVSDITLNGQSDLRFADSDSSHYVGFQAPATVTTNLIWTLPAIDAAVSGYALVSDGSGVLSWGRAGGASGGGTDDIFYENAQTVTTNYTITSNKNAMTAGPVTINSGVTVTVPSGSTWVIV
jgi:hypothetical protein